MHKKYRWLGIIKCILHNILSMNKQRILFVLHLPPPVHGAAMMGKYIHDSRVINEAFECKYINLTSAKTLQDIGKGGVIKYIGCPVRGCNLNCVKACS